MRTDGIVKQEQSAKSPEREAAPNGVEGGLRTWIHPLIDRASGPRVNLVLQKQSQPETGL